MRSLRLYGQNGYQGDMVSIDSENGKSEQPSRGERALGSIRELASAMAAIIALIAALSPLFGEEGLANAIPLPGDLEETGRALISVFTLSVIILFAIPAFLGRPSRIKYIFSGALLLFSILLFGLYLSWIDDSGTVASPAIRPFNAGVVAITTISAAISLLAAGLIVWAGQSLGVSDGKFELTEEVTERIITNPKKEKTEIDELSILALTANWRRITDLAPGKYGLLWRLYGVIARFITSKQNPRHEILTVRGLLRVAGLVQPFQFRSRGEKRFLLNVAKSVYLLLDQASDAWATIDRFSAHRRESRGNLRDGTLKEAYKDGYLKSLESAIWMPARAFGHEIVIRDIEKAYSALLSFRSSARDDFLSLHELNEVEKSLPLTDYRFLSGGARSDPVINAMYKFAIARNKAIRDSFYDVLEEEKKLGPWHRLADAGYKLADDLSKTETLNREGSIEKSALPAHLSQAFCIAIAGDVEGATLRKLKALAYVYQNAVAWKHADTPVLAQRLISVHEKLREDGVEVDDFLMNIVDRAF